MANLVPYVRKTLSPGTLWIPPILGEGKVQVFPFSQNGEKGGEPLANRDRGEIIMLLSVKEIKCIFKNAKGQD
jgi:hypothetical protein